MARIRVDKRSTALLGHPLENAQVTGLYILALLARRQADAESVPLGRTVAARRLVSFGGRTRSF